MIATIAKGLLATMLISAAILAAVQNGRRVPSRTFNAGPTLLLLGAEALLIIVALYGGAEVVR